MGHINYMKGKKRVATINSSGRQAASFIRAAVAVGWEVRAQMKDLDGIVATELVNLEGVTVIEGSLSDPDIIAQLFIEPIDLAFINTVQWGNEFEIGTRCTLAAQAAGATHIIYSSMPDHSKFGMGWQALPQWADKYAIERFIVEQIKVPATFVYCGIYHNNFTSLPYPLFRMELQHDGSFVWRAPFNPEKELPWLDAEHDVGPVVLRIFKDGPEKWNGKRIPLAFEYLTPVQVCAAFSKALSRPVTFQRGPIVIEIKIPEGYHEQLSAVGRVLGEQEAPYFGADVELEQTNRGLVERELWGGNRSIEGYAGDAFQIEEAANGLTWMLQDKVNKSNEDDGLIIEDSSTMENIPELQLPGKGREIEKEKDFVELNMGSLSF